MKAIIFSHTDIIGTAKLEVGDFSMGGIFGEFYPSNNYFEKIQKHVWKFWSSHKTNYEEWTSLNINVQLENGIFLLPTGGITFDDIEELIDEPKRIDLSGVDTKIIEDFIQENPPRPFVEEPWESISIEQKINFENELLKEIKQKKSFFNLLLKTKHILNDSIFSALCKDSTADHVLFEIQSPTIEKRFALVHLTWSEKEENDNFPKTELFTDFDEFKHHRMYPNKIEWED